MTEQQVEKTPREELVAVVSRLKEMAHYSRTHIEHLGQDWFLLEDGLRMKEEAKKMEELLNIENQVQDLLNVMIEEFETKCTQMAQDEG